jgi:aspartate 1-decarboxylase
MQRVLLKSKIHRATVTQAELNYVGSITIDAQLMEAADLVPYEQVQIYDITNGHRLTTYAVPGPAGSGMICINGAAAHLVHPKDLIIIASYAQYSESEVERHQPRIVLVDQHNRICSPEQAAAWAAAGQAEG